MGEMIWLYIGILIGALITLYFIARWIAIKIGKDN